MKIKPTGPFEAPRRLRSRLPLESEENSRHTCAIESVENLVGLILQRESRVRDIGQDSVLVSGARQHRTRIRWGERDCLADRAVLPRTEGCGDIDWPGNCRLVRG